MELKDYQIQTIEQVKKYLVLLAEHQDKKQKVLSIDKSLADSINAPKGAWDEFFKEGKKYNSKKNGIGEQLPNFNLKVPTGGGKTLLATHTIDLINSHYRKKKTGFVLWIVPTNQIYKQTLSSLRDRNHPYRQALDFSSGGRTVILEKMDRFTPNDVENNLVIMLLMLPSANRKTKETLKIFRDAGGYEVFFPSEDDFISQENLINNIPNLDCFNDNENGFFTAQGDQIKTSLGNVLRILKPVIIIDEGQKTYSKGAQETIRGFNPSIIVELSATPNEKSNNLVEILGRDLDKEEMIKLDLHVTNKASTDWKDTLWSSVEKRMQLEKDAHENEAESGTYIRPICLIQVERTGKEQRGKGHIHAEDVRDYLIKERGIPPHHIAVKSSEKDDIEGIDLLSKESSIRYIITKQALQEGWDCSFAYVLAILTNPSSKNGLTQLVGRILRQPYAKKTKIQSLNESYVYCFQQKADTLLKSIKKGLEGEGLGDLSERVLGNIEDEEEETKEQEINVKIRNAFKEYEGKIYLPKFLIQYPGEVTWKEVNYEMDILSRINWEEINLDTFENLSLSVTEGSDWSFKLGLSENVKELVETYEQNKFKAENEIDLVLMTRHISNIVPNPWVAYDYCTKVISSLRKRYSEQEIAANLGFVIEELKKTLTKERDSIAESIFKDLVQKNIVRFMIEEKKGKIPARINKVKKKAKRLLSNSNEPIEKSLIEPVIDDDFNGLERSVALCLEDKENLLWWYRNIARVDYGIQGWKKNKIYPDFLATKTISPKNEYDSIYVLETKGDQLIGNLDTSYKKDVFQLCNELGRKTSWNELGLEFEDRQINFLLVPEDEWKKTINAIYEDY